MFQQIAASANDTEEIRWALQHSDTGVFVPGCLVHVYQPRPISEWYPISEIIRRVSADRMLQVPSNCYTNTHTGFSLQHKCAHASAHTHTNGRAYSR